MDAKFWLRVLTDLKNRGVRDVLMLVCDGLKAFPDAVNTVWDGTVKATVVRREALMFRMEVRDLHLLAVVAVG